MDDDMVVAEPYRRATSTPLLWWRRALKKVPVAGGQCAGEPHGAVACARNCGEGGGTCLLLPRDSPWSVAVKLGLVRWNGGPAGRQRVTAAACRLPYGRVNETGVPSCACAFCLPPHSAALPPPAALPMLPTQCPSGYPSWMELFSVPINARHVIRGAKKTA